MNPDPVALAWDWATPIAQFLGVIAIALLTLAILRDVSRW